MRLALGRFRFKVLAHGLSARKEVNPVMCIEQAGARAVTSDTLVHDTSCVPWDVFSVYDANAVVDLNFHLVERARHGRQVINAPHCEPEAVLENMTGVEVEQPSRSFDSTGREAILPTHGDEVSAHADIEGLDEFSFRHGFALGDLEAKVITVRQEWQGRMDQGQRPGKQGCCRFSSAGIAFNDFADSVGARCEYDELMVAHVSRSQRPDVGEWVLMLACGVRQAEYEHRNPLSGHPRRSAWTGCERDAACSNGS